MRLGREMGKKEGFYGEFRAFLVKNAKNADLKDYLSSKLRNIASADSQKADIIALVCLNVL